MWDFGDGFTANGVIVHHAYVHSGRFSVVLTVVDNRQASAAATSEVTVDVPPIASFSASLKAAPRGVPIRFDGSASIDSDGPIVSYGWGLGDGPTAAGIPATHADAQAGKVTGRLTRRADAGSMVTTARTP